MSRPFRVGLVVILLLAGRSAATPPVPDHLPKYDLTLTVDPGAKKATFRQRVTWTNPTDRPTDQLIFNFYPHYRVPKGDRLLLAKTLELLRLDPTHGIDPNGRHGVLDAVSAADGRKLPFHYREQNPSAIVVELPAPVGPRQSVTIDIDGAIHLPPKQGRWGQWQGVTFLTNAMPVVAYYDAAGWHDVPFVPWHQPFWNEAGVYTTTLSVPTGQVVACSAAVANETDAAGWRKITYKPFVGRDFAVVCSADFREYTDRCTLPDGKVVALKCVAFERHEHYAKQMLKDVSEAIPAFSRWFGPFPYDQFTIAESYFGWNGNECGGLVLIDERIFDMPHLGRGYVEYLVSHETCHQWWYNLVGTNGFAETFVDEGAATYFTHRYLNGKRGVNNALLEWPPRLDWLPNIKRENYRNASWIGAIRRHDVPAAAGNLPDFGHLVGLFSGAYDRGSKIYGMIEQRLGGEEPFLDFTRQLVAKYSFRVLSAAALKRELEAYTGPVRGGESWDEFFDRWVYNKGLTDWSVADVQVRPTAGPAAATADPLSPAAANSTRVEVTLRQKGEFAEPTVLGFQFADGDGFPLRVPVGPGASQVALAEYRGEVSEKSDGSTVVSLTLPGTPTQVAVDPDKLLPDANHGDNVWRAKPSVKLVPLYTILNESDLTNDYDRWNFAAGPWVFGQPFQDPWYTRTTTVGLRAGAFRTQTFAGGIYSGYRFDYRDIVVGADGLFDHWPLPKTQVGFNVEQRVAGPYGTDDGADRATRGVLFGRYVFQYGSSLYLPPISYAEAYTTYSDNFLPFAREPAPGAVRPTWSWLNGLHYRLNLYTPYWDPECGVWFDAVYAGGLVDLGDTVGAHQFRGELAAVQKLPEGYGYFSDIKFAARLVGMTGFPDRGQYFALGGANLYRGFDLAERQGSSLWVANVEARFPVVRDVEWNVADRIAGVRNVYVAGFYDVGGVYAADRQIGNVAHAVGVGLRVDTAVFSFIERATIRLDVAKTVNAASPWQVWFGFQHPF